MNILQINSSARTTGSHSTGLTNSIVERLLKTKPGATLVQRDLAVAPHPLLDETALQALFTPADQRTAEQKARVALDDALIAQAMAADVIVLGVPMYNFGVSAQLKNWIDAIARAGVTFQYSATGVEGLIKGKKVYVVTTRGGVHRDSATDNQVPYLKTMLGFLGMTDIEFIYAEGLAMGPDAEKSGLAAARSRIDELVAA